jgi:hypothetical protein
MPKVLLVNGFSFFFYSNEGNEPVHIHIRKGDAEAKFWIAPIIELEYSEGFSTSELRFIREQLESSNKFIIEKWDEHFS